MNGKEKEKKVFPVITLKNSSHKPGSYLARFCAYTNKKDGTCIKWLVYI